jgi:hypothetical protein
VQANTKVLVYFVARVLNGATQGAARLLLVVHVLNEIAIIIKNEH